jgi:hypothetical protein
MLCDCIGERPSFFIILILAKNEQPFVRPIERFMGLGFESFSFSTTREKQTTFAVALFLLSAGYTKKNQSVALIIAHYATARID